MDFDFDDTHQRAARPAARGFMADRIEPAEAVFHDQLGAARGPLGLVDACRSSPSCGPRPASSGSGTSSSPASTAPAPG